MSLVAAQNLVASEAATGFHLRRASFSQRAPASVFRARRSARISCLQEASSSRVFSSRRGILAGGAAFLLALTPASRTTAEEISDEDLRASILLSSSVVPALSTEQYVAAINRARPVAWSEIEEDIEGDEFEKLGASLLFGPFDEVRQSAFFLPWAILETDTQAAVRAREAYLIFQAAVEQLDKSAAAGAKLLVEPSDVQADFNKVSYALDQLLAQVPSN